MIALEPGRVSRISLYRPARVQKHRRRFRPAGGTGRHRPHVVRTAPQAAERLPADASRAGCMARMPHRSAAVAHADRGRRPGLPVGGGRHRRRPQHPGSPRTARSKKPRRPTGRTRCSTTRLSDFVTLLNIWNRFQEVLGAEKSLNRMKNFCRAHFLSFRRMREWRDIHGQILAILEEERLQGPAKTQPAVRAAKPGESPFGERYAAIHKSILSGFLSNIALKKEKHLYTAHQGREVMVFPGSGLFKSAGAWIVAAETGGDLPAFCPHGWPPSTPAGWRNSGRTQCRYTYLEPHWERYRGEVVAPSRSALYRAGDRSRATGFLRPDRSREAAAIFVRSALLEGDVRRPLPFMDHNRRQIEAVRRPGKPSAPAGSAGRRGDAGGLLPPTAVRRVRSAHPGVADQGKRGRRVPAPEPDGPVALCSRPADPERLSRQGAPGR